MEAQAQDRQREVAPAQVGVGEVHPQAVELREWTDPFNSFNSWKGLTYYEQYRAILAGHFLPPIEASIDPTYKCNVDCIWCNSQRILHNRELLGKAMPPEHLLKLVDFLVDWGVRGFCYAGGGDPTLHPYLWEAMRRATAAGRKNAIISNGIAIDTFEKQETLAKCCRWVGISLDAGTPELFAKVKRTAPSNFEKVLDNVRSMVQIIKQNGYRCDVAIKYLVHPSNAHEIAKACAIARDLGVAHFHARPAASENIEGLGEALDFPMDVINEQLAQCLEMQTEDFKTFGVRHKFSNSFNLKNNFSRCLSAPLAIQLGADGNVYFCVDWRGSKDHILCTHYPDPEQIRAVWSSPEHVERMRRVVVETCPRCTYGVYARPIEHVVENDEMCIDFP